MGVVRMSMILTNLDVDEQDGGAAIDEWLLPQLHLWLICCHFDSPAVCGVLHAIAQG